jgi:TetR/AcrR family transcriptional regulator, acrAB operon repressor
MFATMMPAGILDGATTVVRRTKREAAATREALLDAALRVFRERGVARTTLAQIAAAAGVTRGAVYWHFRDKVEVFTAACERVQLPMEAMLAQVGESRQRDPLAALREVALAALSRLATDPGAQAVFDVIFHKCEFAGEFAAVIERRQCADGACDVNVERLLKQAVALRQLPRDTDTRLAARSVSAFMVGVMHQWVQRPDAYDLGAAAPQMLDAFIAGLRAQPPRRAAAGKRAAARSGTIHEPHPQPARAT